ncbi:MAG: ABC transporter ATP-binding protein [Chloroflexi bacterium]|nr:MAG: ABC transporter ATP-binding protein [Chloroflexota bacterium]
MSYLNLEKITKNFPGCKAVDELDLEVEQGEFIVLLGPSGCGKTTTLRIIAGLEIQSSGKVILDGKDVSDTPPERRDMAMVFQNLALYPHMTVYQNIAFYLQNIHTSKDDIDRRVRQSARRVEIEELLERKPNQLSGGQRQRVALARALVRSPKLFLLDEPLAALDAKLRAGMRSEFKLLHRSLNEQESSMGTFIYVTHDQIEAMTLGTRVAVIYKGKVVQFSPPKELYKTPKNLFVAAFVGSPEMNLIEGSLSGSNGSTNFEFQGMSFKTGTRGVETLQRIGQEAGEVVLGIRPEAVTLGSTTNLDSLPFEILTIEPFGQTNFVRLRSESRVSITCLVNPDLSFKEGEIVGVNFNPDCVHYFNKQTGENVLA